MSLTGEVTAAHNRLMHGKRALRTRDDIPHSYESITSEWLTAVICADVSDAVIVNHKLDTPDDGTSNRRRIYLEYNEAGTVRGLPASVFCKAAFDVKNKILLAHTCGPLLERVFYSQVRSRLDIEAPRALYAAYDPKSFTGLIILEDLRGKVSFCDEKTKMSRQRAESQLRLLAALHGHYFQSPEFANSLEDVMFWPDRFHRMASFHLRDICEAGFRAAKDVLPPELFARESEVWPATLNAVERHRVLPQTLTHGDVHLKNWYVTKGGEMGLSDWQALTRGHWSRDIAYAISCALEVEDRRAWEADLIRYYLDRLGTEGGPKVTFDEAWLNYRQQLLHALAWWTGTLTPTPDMPDMQPQETAIEFIRRFGAAINDHHALDSFS